MSRNEAFRLSNAQAEKLQTPYPLSDLRNPSEMKNVPEVTGRLLPDPEDRDAGAALKDAATVLIDSLDFHVNRPVRWNAGRDMNIARPGASVVIDPAVKDGVPTIMGTDVTTRAAAERITAYPDQDGSNAQQLGITVTQLQVASLYETVLLLPRPLGHIPMGRWHFGVPGAPENAAQLVSRLILRLHPNRTQDEEDQEQADHAAGPRTA